MQRGWVVSPEYRTAIDAIKAARVEQGLSQRELARRLGKHPSFVNKIEQLERRLDVLEFIAIARAIGVAETALLQTIVQALPASLEV
ncbi:helix-turn-helix transcriptional regulator [Sphingopyxis sp.]|jgi:transcriptional regulator with XRE-family HTH domain|uniref:helix-turn-helix domain-containing protein n=1 Tax=Sphingopyxis sp. TaxID=1908224 RepID=UPI002DE3D952|nr:helix-turn-helix transcriptional regulator [Sphingopyxis sp.]